MARYCAEPNSETILKAGEYWRDRALVGQGSVLSDGSLWTRENVSAIEEYFVKQPDIGEGSFFEKLQKQLAPTTASVKQLAAEMLWVMMLCPSNVTPGKKREMVKQVWDWSGEALPEDTPWLKEEVLTGIGSAGAGFSVNRWRELDFFVRCLLKFRDLPEGARTALLSDGWKFSEWLGEVPEADVRQLRPMLLYLLFPDTFERIFGGGDRRLIVSSFTGKSLAEVRPLSAFQLDEQLAAVRKAQEARYPGQALDFYIPPLSEQWHGKAFSDRTKDIESEHVLAALHEIDEHGVPSDAESTFYDLIYGTHRYPPKLVLSLASKHASGEEFDRGFFNGGKDSPAFKLLQQLGFHIERKDFVEDLLKRFFAQAGAGADLGVQDYPKAYRGLHVRVSFGKGNFAKVPWISFLGFGQQTRDGIYPVFLYYKARGVLVLAYGVSDTAVPSASWALAPDVQSVKAFFESKFGQPADRYGESFVYAAYDAPGAIDPGVVTKDLDALIDAYEKLFAKKETNYGKEATVIPPEARSGLVAPQAMQPVYTVEDFADECGFETSRIEDWLTRLRRKQHVVFQGPPGTGKTFVAERLAQVLVSGSQGTKDLVQFHPSYAYEDFMQGIRPEVVGGQLTFKLTPGRFLKFCETARTRGDKPCVLIIDEINRANLSKVFGELMYLLEYRDAEIPLSMGGDKFKVPKNVFIVGTMNTADRSIALVDHALRRRFSFISLRPDYEVLRKHLERHRLPSYSLIQALREVNAAIDDPHYEVGISFFLADGERLRETLSIVWTSEIEPYLEEYFYDQPDKMEALRWESFVKTSLAEWG